MTTAAEALEEVLLTLNKSKALTFVIDHADTLRAALQDKAPCDHIWEAVSVSNSLLGPFEAVCQKCGAKPAMMEAKVPAQEPAGKS